MKNIVPPGGGAGFTLDDLKRVHPDYVANPEFLREGKALQDWLHPFPIVLEAEPCSVKTIETVRVMNSGIESPSWPQTPPAHRCSSKPATLPWQPAFPPRMKWHRFTLRCSHKWMPSAKGWPSIPEPAPGCLPGLATAGPVSRRTSIRSGTSYHHTAWDRTCREKSPG